MKRLSHAMVLVLLLSSTATLSSTSINNSGPAVNGDFHFTVGDGLERSVEFSARIDKDGQTNGGMSYNHPGLPPDYSAVSMKAEFDCLVIRGHNAVMSGLITDSNVGSVIGYRVLLVVEDNGEGRKASELDKLTWGIYEPLASGWIPTDAEVPGDQGALLDWLATDAERNDDLGIPARRSTVVGCHSFSISSYSFIDILHGGGNVQVKP